MLYVTDTVHRTKYQYVSSNQHGDRYKAVGSKRIPVVTLRAKSDCAKDLSDLIALGSQLKVPVHYDFDEQQAYLEVVSIESV